MEVDTLISPGLCNNWREWKGEGKGGREGGRGEERREGGKGRGEKQARWWFWQL